MRLATLVVIVTIFVIVIIDIVAPFSCFLPNGFAEQLLSTYHR